MAIRVTCSKCMARFDVSEKFAGREGPCPKCKAPIRIPDASEEVKIHAPESSGPKDSSGRPVLRPVRRRETVLSPGQIAVIALIVAGFVAVSFLMREFFPDRARMPFWVIPALLVALAPGCVVAAYSFLRDDERGAFLGRELWTRVAICSGIYALLWMAMLAGGYAFGGYGTGAWVTAGIVMLGAGTAAAVLTLDLDWLMGIVHYGLYFGSSLLMRWAAGVGALPQDADPVNLPATPAAQPAGPLGWLGDAALALAAWMAGG